MVDPDLPVPDTDDPEVAEADALEQAVPATPDDADVPDETGELPMEADVADVLDQARVVGVEDDR